MENFNINTTTSTTMEDYNLPSTERSDLLKGLHDAVGDGDVPPYFWALCQVCDLYALRQLIEVARISPPIVRILATQAYTIVLYWTQSTQGTSRTSTTPQARDRDGHCCVLSKDSSIEVAHIYPFCRLSTSEENVFGARHIFWNHLKYFWPEEKVTSWEAELFPSGLAELGVEGVDNRITLSKTAHSQWNRGAFALKPITVSEDNTTLTVRFFWQKKQPDIQAAISLLAIPLSTEHLNQNEGAFDYGQTKLHNEGDKLIKSGDEFKIKTDDPIKKPLPSFKLLELQWCLMRVIGMAGAAFPYELSSGDNSDEDVPGLDLDDVGDTSVLSDISQSFSPEILHKVNKVLAESSKHYTNEPEEDRGRISMSNIQI